MEGSHRTGIVGDVALLDCPACIYLTDAGRCSLKKTVCAGKSCQSRQVASDERWRQRMSALPAEQQASIARKYYGGTYPWKEGKHGNS